MYSHNSEVLYQVARMTRRGFLQGAMASLAGVALPIPKARAGLRAYNLSAAPAKVKLLGVKGAGETDVWTYSGSTPGPLVRARQGERLRIDVSNGLPQETTLHCHGLRIPNAMDGVPELTQAPIQQGERFVYEFDLHDAGTFWYHSHTYSAEQVGRGLNGALIIDEKEPPIVDRDLVWVINDWRVNNAGVMSDDFNHPHDISHGGRIGNLITLNGAEWEDFDVKAGERLRIRLINAANARVMGFKFGGFNPKIVAQDGHPVKPYEPTGGQIVFGPGQRVDLIVDIAGKPGERLAVVDDYYKQFAYTFITFNVEPGEVLRGSPLDAPITLPGNSLPEPDLANAETKKVLIEGGAMGGLRATVYKGDKVELRKLWRQHRKVWVLNGVASSGVDMDPIFKLKLGKSYRWRIHNDTVWDHPMHLHGHAFRVIERNGKPEPHTPWADTVLLYAGDVVDIAFVADNPGDWLFHCHVLEHHSGGMGAVVRVA